MKGGVWIIAAATVLVVLAGLAVAGLAPVGGGMMGRYTARPPLVLPAADAFRPGVCRDAAGPISALGRFSHRRALAKRLTDGDRAELATQSGLLVPLRDRVQPAAEPMLADQMVTLLAAIGFVRIRTGPTYDPQLLRDMETARVAVQSTCTRARP
jgi:hypothetical protein